MVLGRFVAYQNKQAAAFLKDLLSKEKIFYNRSTTLFGNLEDISYC